MKQIGMLYDTDKTFLNQHMISNSIYYDQHLLFRFNYDEKDIQCLFTHIL